MHWLEGHETTCPSLDTYDAHREVAGLKVAWPHTLPAPLPPLYLMQAGKPVVLGSRDHAPFPGYI